MHPYNRFNPALEKERAPTRVAVSKEDLPLPLYDGLKRGRKRPGSTRQGRIRAVAGLWVGLLVRCFTLQQLVVLAAWSEV